MTFKEFYLQSSKGDKAPPRAEGASRPKDAGRDFGSDREAEGSQVSVWRRLISTSTTKLACPKLPLNRTYGGHRRTDANDPMLTSGRSRRRASLTGCYLVDASLRQRANELVKLVLRHVRDRPIPEIVSLPMDH